VKTQFVNLPRYITGYFSLVIPYVPARFASPWHPTDKDFAPLSCGSFRTEEDAIDWARAKLRGAPYSLRWNDGCGIPYSWEYLESKVAEHAF
jgi:hypothetical protein